ncbi:MAG: VTT domain-containing protein [Oceanipulchritudo sp.]
MDGRAKTLAGGFGVAAVLVVFIVSYRHLPDFGDPDILASPGEPLTGTGRWLMLLAISVGTLLSEDLACISAGLLAATGRLDYASATLAAFAGIFVGDTLIYGLGYFFGRPLLRHRWSRLIVSERAVDRAAGQFRRYGAWIILITRFIPGTRSATYFSAGALHAPFGRFVLVFALAAALWTPFLVGLSHLLGNRLLRLYENYEALALPALGLALLLLYIFFHYGIPLFTWRGRRRLRGKWIRATQWEFWPVWQVNWVVFLYVLYLGIFRYRRPTLFTAVNPCMPHGGVVGESKGTLLEALAADGEALPAWRNLPPGPVPERMAHLEEAMEALGLDWPVVLKPDEGQRGLGVAIIRDKEAARGWLAGSRGTAILQAYVGGLEFGIFHFRYPSETRGRTFSIARKVQLEVTGTGRDTLETLILKHPRAIALLDTFLDRFAGELERIPAKGEVLALGELGTHALGSLFLDGTDLRTPELEKRMDEIAAACPGFHFGRFDLKAPDEDHLRRGEGLKVLEVNGLTSEAAHIYDPRHGLLHAWMILCRQWRIAFEIAEENAQRGARVTPFREFVRDTLASLRRQGAERR